MEPLILYREGDEQIFLRLWDDEDKTVRTNIDDLDDLQVRISIGNTLIDSWNKTGSGDFKALIRVDAYNYYFWLETDSATKLGRVNLWIETIVSNAQLADGYQNTITTELNFINIVEKSY